MRAGKVIGRVVATCKTQELEGIKLLLIQPADWLGNPAGDPLIATDSVGAGAGEFIFYVEAREAAVAHPGIPAIDAAVMGIIDGVNLLKELL